MYWLVLRCSLFSISTVATRLLDILGRGAWRWTDKPLRWLAAGLDNDVHIQHHSVLDLCDARVDDTPG